MASGSEQTRAGEDEQQQDEQQQEEEEGAEDGDSGMAFTGYGSNYS
jgi:hypothetical protein